METLISTLAESVTKLHGLLPKLNESDTKFASSLIASFHKYHGLTPKQTPWIEKLIAKAEASVAKAPVTTVVGVPEPVSVGDFSGVIALFTKAAEHLKHPKVNLLVGGVKIVLSLNGAKSSNPGAVSVNGEGKYPYRKFYGRVTPEGVFKPYGAYAGESFIEALTTVLSALSKNPARVAAEYGKLTGHCCFCNKELGKGKEKRSVLVGYGPDCAEHHGLKDKWNAAADKAEAKASVAPLKLAGPWLGSANAPTLTVSPAAQTVIDKLAAEIETWTPTVEEVVNHPVSEEFKDHNPVEIEEPVPVAANELAESLAKATGAVKVTVTDGPDTATFEPDYLTVSDASTTEKKLFDLTVSDGASGKAVVVTICYLCDKVTETFTTLHDHPVCHECRAQLGTL